MPYVGNKPEVGNFRKCDAITTSATATYNLLVGGVAVNPNQNQCIVSLNGVIQSSGTSYTIASSQITFASALTSSDVIDFILILGDTLNAGIPSDSSVDASKITANVITGQSALGATPADTDELLISDAGTLKRVDYSYLKSSVVNRPNALPIIINGDMAVAQRSTSVTGVTTDGYKTCDRIRPSFTGGGIGTYTFIQESLTSGNAFANGFTKAFRLDCTTADASPAAGDYFYLAYKIEGNNLQAFKKGTANAQKMTLAFWVKSNKTGTAQVNMNDQDNTRMCSGTYTISSANTWEHKVINIAADTTGAFDNDNANSMQIEWWLDGGSNFQGGAVPTAWEARSNTDRGVSDLAIADSTSNDFAITGIQLEVGTYTSSTLPPFQFESYAENLLRCQRYYHKYQLDDGSAGGISLCDGYWENSTTFYGTLVSNPTMRSTPSMTTTGTVSDYGIRCTSNTIQATTLDILVNTNTNCRVRGVVSSGGTQNAAGQILDRDVNNNTFVALHSEL